jgi:hypothetical protein
VIKNKIKTISLIVVSGAALMMYAGCASSVDRGSLSDAMDEANDRHKGDRRVVGTTNDRHEDDTSSCLSSCFSSCLFSIIDSFGHDDGYSEPTPSTEETNNDGLFTISGRNFFGVRILTSNRFSNNYTNSTGVGLLWVNHYRDRRAIETATQVEVITTDEKSDLFGSVNSLFDLEAGLHGRSFSTPDFTLLGLYLKYGCDLNFLFWHYKNPFASEVRDEWGEVKEIDTIRTDGLFGINADIGLGWSFVQTERLKVSLEVLAGGTLFWFKTFQSFENDIFKPDGYIKIGIEFLFGTEGW